MTGKERRWALIVHGGAKDIDPRDAEANRSGCVAAAEAGRALLKAGASALDAAESAVRVLEALPVFNAGYGSVLTEKGEVEMDASIMDGATLDIGAVCAVKGVRHPVSVARLLLAERTILLAGEGARAFAEEKGAELCAPEEMIAEAALAGHDTVGCVALDVEGHVAVATSTGGLSGTPAGRVGDSPLPGCGFYADDTVGAAGFTGHGEGIARLVLAARTIAAMKEKGPETALREGLELLPALGFDGGGIAIDREGRIGWWHNSPAFAVAACSSADDTVRVWLSKDEGDNG
jgi:beta-aspartyl-peptidase (threonine type)